MDDLQGASLQCVVRLGSWRFVSRLIIDCPLGWGRCLERWRARFPAAGDAKDCGICPARAAACRSEKQRRAACLQVALLLHGLQHRQHWLPRRRSHLWRRLSMSGRLQRECWLTAPTEEDANVIVVRGPRAAGKELLKHLRCEANRNKWLERARIQAIAGSCDKSHRRCGRHEVLRLVCFECASAAWATGDLLPQPLDIGCSCQGCSGTRGLSRIMLGAWSWLANCSTSPTLSFHILR